MTQLIFVIAAATVGAAMETSHLDANIERFELKINDNLLRNMLRKKPLLASTLAHKSLVLATADIDTRLAHLEGHVEAAASQQTPGCRDEYPHSCDPIRGVGTRTVTGGEEALVLPKDTADGYGKFLIVDLPPCRAIDNQTKSPYIQGTNETCFPTATRSAEEIPRDGWRCDYGDEAPLCRNADQERLAYFLSYSGYDLPYIGIGLAVGLPVGVVLYGLLYTATVGALATGVVALGGLVVALAVLGTSLAFILDAYETQHCDNLYGGLQQTCKLMYPGFIEGTCCTGLLDADVFKELVETAPIRSDDDDGNPFQTALKEADNDYLVARRQFSGLCNACPLEGNHPGTGTSRGKYIAGGESPEQTQERGCSSYYQHGGYFCNNTQVCKSAKWGNTCVDVPNGLRQKQEAITEASIAEQLKKLPCIGQDLMTCQKTYFADFNPGSCCGAMIAQSVFDDRVDMKMEPFATWKESRDQFSGLCNWCEGKSEAEKKKTEQGCSGSTFCASDEVCEAKDFGNECRKLYTFKHKDEDGASEHNKHEADILNKQLCSSAQYGGARYLIPDPCLQAA